MSGSMLAHIGAEEASMPTTVKVSNFGPIARGSVELRPLTVFFGPNNSGKTFLSTLIYGLHKITNGFSAIPRFDVWHQWMQRSAMVGSYSQGSEAVTDLNHFAANVLASSHAIKFDSLPQAYLDLLHEYHTADDGLATVFEEELRYLYNRGSTEELIQVSSSNRSSMIKLSVHGDQTHSKQDQAGWDLEATLDGTQCTTNVNIGSSHVINIDKLPEYAWPPYADKDPTHDNLRSALGQLNQILGMGPSYVGPTKVWFLPASRSGIMLAHRIIAGETMRRATRRGFGDVGEAYALPGTIADFVANLLLFTDRRQGKGFQEKLARFVEANLLLGTVEAHQQKNVVVPAFVYTPDTWEEGIPLADSSSMVTELAPLVVYLRGFVRSGHTLIIEEPEAHLHPEVQTKVALAIARMVRAGIRLVITTHSDWLLAEISNLIRAGELKDPRSEWGTDPTTPPRLRASEVGVWGFEVDPDSRTSTVKELPFRWIGGVEPPKIFEVAEAMHEQTAQLIREHEDGLGHEIE
ncbi:MAG: AAA family ATPase [Caldilineaceae bacterium SB0665_bin_21]|nr:AAA family ATPase [Caldilineaceae bacterium SB0665_bin_21]